MYVCVDFTKEISINQSIKVLRSRLFLDLGIMSFIDEDLTCFSQKPLLAHFQPNFECKLVGTS